MKRIILIITLLAFALTHCVKKGKEQNQGEKIRTQTILVTFVLGKVVYKSQNIKSWKALKVGYKLKINDAIRVGSKGRTVLQSETGSVITIKSNSELKIASLLNPKNNEETTELQLKTGKTIINPRKLLGKSRFSVRTPSMVAGVRGTVFSVEYRSGKSKVLVKEGKVAVKPALKSQKLKVQEVEKTLPEVEVNPGQKAEVTLSEANEASKKVEASINNGQASEKAKSDSSKAVNLSSMQENETAQINEDAKELTKLNINMDNLKEDGIVQKEEGQEKKSLGAITITSFGSDIFINDKKVGADYYSSLYPDGTNLKIIVKKQEKIILDQVITIPVSGVKIDLTPKKEVEKELKNLEVKKQKPFTVIAQGIKLKGNTLQKSEKSLIFINRNRLKVSLLEDVSAKPLTISTHPKVKPVVTQNAIFTANRQGDLMIYSPQGKLRAKVKLGKILFGGSIATDGKEAFLGNNFGEIIGVNTAGKKIFSYKVARGEVVTSVIPTSKYLVIGTAYKAYILDRSSKKLIKKVFVNNSSRLQKKIGVAGDTMIFPQENRRVTIRNMNGKILKSITAVPGDIEVISSKRFAIRYNSKTKVYNTQGKLLRNINSGKVIFTQGKAVYPVGKKVIIDGFTSTKSIDLPEMVKLVGKEDNTVYAVSQSGKLYQIKL